MTEDLLVVGIFFYLLLSILVFAAGGFDRLIRWILFSAALMAIGVCVFQLLSLGDFNENEKSLALIFSSIISTLGLSEVV